MFNNSCLWVFICIITSTDLPIVCSTADFNSNFFNHNLNVHLKICQYRH
uniref:Uncharacterized protein n=1 Tax=Siphoviridae sp. ctaLC6 TaxID=2826387 RepID=A0A8S5MPS5_9CAUD|nr:MAG TPA: hypothetical protein [Siphoviridae sp. ctaLC6]